MKHLSLSKSLIPIVLALGAVSAFASPIIPGNATLVVDGSVAEWGVILTNTVSGVGGSNLQPNTPVPGSGSSACLTSPLAGKPFACEDTDPSVTGITPYSGAQDYDVEFLGLAQKQNKLYIGLITGQRPDNGATLYSPGDLFLTINGIKYAIEMGGGIGGAVAGAQLGGAAGSTYTINGSGYTTGLGAINAAQTTGSIWQLGTGDTLVGLNNSAGTGQAVQFSKSGTSTLVGSTTSFYSTRNSLTGNQSDHAIWEMSIDLSAVFGIGALQNFTATATWSPGCFNDTLSTTGERLVNDTTSSSSGNGNLPEPGSLVLVGLGLLGFSTLRRNRTA